MTTNSYYIINTDAYVPVKVINDDGSGYVDVVFPGHGTRPPSGERIARHHLKTEVRKPDSKRNLNYNVAEVKNESKRVKK